MFVRWNDTLKFYEYDTSAGQTGAGPWVQLPNIVYEDQRNVFTGSLQTIEADHPMVFFKQMAIPPGNRATRIEGFSDLYFSHVNDANDAYVTRMQFSRAGNLHLLNGKLFERGRAYAQGDWTVQPFNQGNFFGNGGMVWTVPNPSSYYTNQWMVVGGTLTWSVFIGPTTLSGSPGTSLSMVLPAGITNINTCCAAGQVYTTGGWRVSHLFCPAAQNVLYVYLNPSDAAYSLDTCYVGFQMSFQFA